MKRHLLTGTIIAALLAGSASADTLREALNAAYRTNPTLTGQREALKVTDSSVAIARAAGRPQVSAVVGINRDLTAGGSLRRLGKGPYLTGGVDVSYPLFSGGSVRNSITAARTRVEAGRATLRAVEGDIFTEAVAAYMDVIRDRAIVELNDNQARVLGTNLEAARDRFEIGDITRTDVAQSEARQALARSALETARGRLQSSEENYRRVIGQRPGVLAPPPPLPPLPATADHAVQIALVNNPDFIAITRQAEAARFDIRVAEAARLPTVSGVASGDYVNTLAGDTGGGPRSGTATSIGVQGRIPLYQGGLPAARIAQSIALEGQTLEQRVATERAVIATTRSAFAIYRAALGAIASNQVAVTANELALEGARAENSVGTRTILDVLDAEQELLNSQVLLVTARRDSYVAGFQLLNAMGQAEADDLGLDGGPLYDPLGNYRSVAGNWNDWATPRRSGPTATSTATPQGATAGLGFAAAIGDRAAMQSPREPSMEDILASIKRVIAEEKELRAAIPPPPSDSLDGGADEEDILELDRPVEGEPSTEAPPVDTGPPLLDDEAADASRMKLEQLTVVAAAAPPPPTVNPLEEMLRDMLRPALKQWLDDNLPRIVDEHVRREISRITGKPL